MRRRVRDQALHRVREARGVHFLGAGDVRSSLFDPAGLAPFAPLLYGGMSALIFGITLSHLGRLTKTAGRRPGRSGRSGRSSRSGAGWPAFQNTM